MQPFHNFLEKTSDIFCFKIKVDVAHQTGQVPLEPFVECHYFQRSVFNEPVYLLEENRLCFKDVTSLVEFCRLNRVNDLPGLLSEHPPIKK